MGIPILGSNSASTGYEISNSLRFNDGDDPYLARTPSSSGSRTKATVSFWVKRGNLAASSNHYILEASSSTSPFNMSRVRFTDDLLIIDNTLNGGADNGFYFQSTREYRDPSAWYHIFFSVDVTQAVATNGWELYVNGVQQTLALEHWTQNANLEWSQSGVQMNIGRRHDNGTEHLDGYLAEFHYIDGTRKSYTDFGEFNDNGVWIPKEYTGGSYGTNGFYMQFQQTGTSANSSGMGADTSGNDNHFTPNNLAAIDVTTDTCTNNFATWNPLDPNRNDDLSEGNTQYVSPTSAREQIRSTFGLTSGKWYWETKPTTANGGSSVGVLKENASMTLDDSLGKDAYGWSYDSDGSSRHSNSSTSSGFDTYTTNDIIGVALDLDNHEIFFYKNGTAQNSGNKAFDLDTGETYFAACGSNSNGNTETFQVNFGNAPFSISSGNSDANGYGNFEYAVPSGYYALCTKNLGQFG